MKQNILTLISFLAVVLCIPLFYIYLKPVILNSSWLNEIVPQDSGKMWEVFRGQIARLTHLAAVLSFLLLIGYRRHDFFLAAGRISSPAERFAPFRIKRGESWLRIGLIIGGWICSITLLFTLLQVKPDLSALGDSFQQIPLMLLNAGMNSFYEEFIFRASLIPLLLSICSKTTTIYITAIIFGVCHLHGNSLSGIVFAAMAAYLGLLLAKSMIETKGMLLAWILHGVLDVIVFYAITVDSVMDAQNGGL